MFADGSEAEGGVLIGCDGVHSTVRPIIDPAAPAPAYSGLINTGGYASARAGPALLRGGRAASTTMMRSRSIQAVLACMPVGQNHLDSGSLPLRGGRG